MILGEEMGKALAYVMGDLRDWPKRCGWCGSERLIENLERQILHCEDCARQTSNEVAYQFRLDRARAEVTGQPRRFREVDAEEPLLRKVKDCGFCQGKPVGNAATWVDGKPRPAAPCPRCGVVTPYPDVESERKGGIAGGVIDGEYDSPNG